jgi:hypothetical protein
MYIYIILLPLSSSLSLAVSFFFSLAAYEATIAMRERGCGDVGGLEALVRPGEPAGSVCCGGAVSP